jgi:hypothetical protein
LAQKIKVQTISSRRMKLRSLPQYPPIDFLRQKTLNSPNMNSIENISVQLLNKAIGLKTKIESLEKQLAQIFGSPTKPATHASPKKRRTMSAAARAKISAAAKKRWAKVRGSRPTVSPKPKKKGGMSAAGRAKISAAAKARWKIAKAAGKKTL